MILKPNWTLFVTCITLIFLSSGCKKNQQETKFHQFHINQSLIFKLPVTIEEKLLVKNLAKITDILKELYKVKANLEEVNAAIFSGIYVDGSILLKDLIFPGTSVLQTNKNFLDLMKNLKRTPGDFSLNFWKEVQTLDDPSFKSFLTSLGKAQDNNISAASRTADGSQSIDEVSIYFPYIENFKLSEREANYTPPLINLMTATADADEGIGYQPFYDINGKFLYKEVILNDEVTELSPTHIIGVNGVQPAAIQSSVQGAPFSPGQPITAPGLTREVKQVYIGEVRCSKQYDALISFTGNGGGSEIRFARGDGFLKEQDSQVRTADVFIMGDSKSFSRSDIKNNRWKDFTTGWDEDWEPNNREQFFAIYEDDNRNSNSFKFGVETTVKQIQGVIIGGNIGGELNYKSDDNIIKQTNYKFDSFFSLNRVNLEGEMRNGWPVRDKKAAVSFTFFDRTIF